MFASVPRWFACLALGLCIVGNFGCSPDSPPGRKNTNQPFEGQTLNVFIYSDYIDKGLLSEFEKKTGAKVNVNEYSDEPELEAKLLVSDTPYDVVFPSDRSMAPLLKKGLLAKIDKSKLTNWKNLDPKFLNQPMDQGNQYSVPYFWGTAAVGVRTDKVKKAVRGFEALFDPEYKGHIAMLEDPENVVAISMLYLGHPLNSLQDDHLSQVKDLLQKQAPLVQSYLAYEKVKEKLISGEAWVGLCWSGDLLQAREQNAAIQVVVPESGTLIFVDSIAIPKSAKNVELAHEFINFLLDPEVAARNANFVKYPSPNAAARDRIDAKLLNDPAIYPPAKVLERCQWLTDRGPAIRKVEKLWKAIVK